MTDRNPGHFDFGHHVRRAGRTGLFWKHKGGSPKPRRPSGPKLKKILTWIGIIGVMTFFAGTIALIGVFAWVSKDLPDPDKIIQRSIPQTTKIYDRTGEHVLYEIHGAQKRTVIELDAMSPFVKQATLAAEDRGFYEHKGFDVRGILRGALRNITRSGGKLQSGSTITQQFIKKAVLNDEQTYTRKVKELVLSVEIERRFSKDQILKLYLNEIPYGSVAYGIESAAQTFFGKTAKDLTLSEAALLASLPKGPTYYSPYGNHLDDLKGRQHYIIDGMVEEGFVSREDADAAKEDDVFSRIKPKREPIVAPHFVFYVKEQLADEFGEQLVERGGLKVITTLDIEKQEAAEKAITDHLEDIKKWKADTAAMAAIDPRTGDILAMVGSADYFDEEINGNFNAMAGKLQPGSSIKPIVYAAAFEKGYTPSTVVEDIKTNFSTSAKEYSPNNYDLGERGFVTLKEALAGSLNIPAVKVLYLTGFDRFQDFAKRVGYSTFGDRSQYGLSLVLGGAVVRPVEHIAAFGAFAQEGIWHPSRAVLRVEDKDGKMLKEETEPAEKRAFDQQVARQINDILSDNAARAYIFGEKNWLTLPDRPVAAKTGTTNEYKDAWTVGYTPSIVAGVWVGQSKGELMKQGADGSKIAAPIWNQFMREALRGTRVESFTAPEPVVTGKPVLDGEKNSQVAVKIDRISGKLATAFTPLEYVEEKRYGVPHSILFFVDKDDPRGPIPEHPEEDPQFQKWETPIAEWAAKQSFTATPAPTEYDDVHVPENVPVLSILSPADGSTVSDRTFVPQVSASARRGITKVEYFMDGTLVGIGVFNPFSANVNVPNRVTKGFRTFTAKAHDDVGNSTTSTVTVNFTADAGPLGVQWTTPYVGQFLYGSDFPFLIRFTIDDPKSVERLLIAAKDEFGASQVIGNIDHPALPNMAFTWQTAPASGRYQLTVEATLTSGEYREESIQVNVR